MHLRDASVDLEGNIIASGVMMYPNDTQGHFPIVTGDQLCISRIRGTRVAVCTAVRDKSGFLKSEARGPYLGIPPDLAAVMLRVLRSGAKETMNITLDYEAGALASSAEGEYPN